MSKVIHVPIYADLHTHTTASDGLLTPTELIAYAAKKELPCISITDHDTTQGLEEGITAGIERGVVVIPGIELNTQYRGDEIHLLGYYIDFKLDWLQSILFKIREARLNRGEQMVHRLNQLYKFNLSFEDVLKEAGGGAIARPHIARVMIRLRYVANMSEAFQRFLGSHCPAYVDRYRLMPEEGIQLIQRAGGVSVLAHPGLLPKPSLVSYIIDQKIEGIEVYHSKHTQDQSSVFKALCSQYGLIITGGSDCHGELDQGMPILGSVGIGKSSVEMLKTAARNFA